VKAVGAHVAHRTEVGGVVVDVQTLAESAYAGKRLSILSNTLLVEEVATEGREMRDSHGAALENLAVGNCSLIIKANRPVM
jgi:hypothetical protein